MNTKNPLPVILLITQLATSVNHASPESVLDATEQLGKQTFWVNRDTQWFERNIPILESPNPELDTTYYYRWELVTRHLVYAHPNTGYVFTEFANRPFWSGAYGTISCPAGMQFDDIRWLADPRYARDYLRFWMRHPGAQPRNYSFWAAESAWSIHQTVPNSDFIVELLPDLIENFRQWEARSWVPDVGLFWQLGHDDGMEFDINAQQTKDILRGGQSLRPSFNSYMWADASALAKIATLAGRPEIADLFEEKAAGIKHQLQTRLWDPERTFFFPMSNQRHEKDGHVVEKHTLTYQTGQFAGSTHGRELHGYVPWVFNLPDPGFEEAWRFLMDEAFFKAPFGPTTVERNDPLFTLKDGCCWWSGQSWPFATAQTLKALGNLLQNYQQDHVDRDDYAELLHTFSISHRKDGKPYIAEALNPFTGSWKGHDFSNRSEHYFHSGFTDLVITGLAGLQPSASEVITIAPLIPDSWDYFALDAIPYHGHKVAVIWDRNGERYRRGQGLQLIVDGKTIARSDVIGRLSGDMPGGSHIIPMKERPKMNFAVNNDGDYFPRYRTSFSGQDGKLSMLHDGEYIYDQRPTNRWTTTGSPNSRDWITIEFGNEFTIDQVQLYVIDDGPGSPIRTPEAITLEYWHDESWQPINVSVSRPEKLTGGRPYSLEFSKTKTRKLRVTLTHADGKASALTEIMVWGDSVGIYNTHPPEGNFAYNSDPAGGFPKASASFHDRYGGIPAKAIDGRTIFQASPSNRWTSYGSPNQDSDWFELDFGAPKKIGRIVLHIYDDGGGVRPPKSLSVEAWTGDDWEPVTNLISTPGKPTGGQANDLRFTPTITSKLRVIFEHIGIPNVRSGVTELEAWAE